MRLWTLHPRHLDPKGLVALWREALLAQHVLQGRTRGYRHHPQLQRFQALPDPPAALARYLRAVHDEAVRRGYTFDASKIGDPGLPLRLAATDGQLRYEWDHLLRKLALRSPAWHAQQAVLPGPGPHPLFDVVPGPVAPWERPSLG